MMNHDSGQDFERQAWDDHIAQADSEPSEMQDATASKLKRWLGLRPKPAKNPRRPILQLPRKYDKDGLLYHSFRFGLVGNLRVLMCRMLGHRLSKKPGHYCCQRCGLAYEEIYHKKGKGYYIEAGIVEDDDTRVPAQQE